MIEISYREFWRNFGKYRDGYESVRVVAKGGEVVGHWYPAGTDSLGIGEVRVEEVVSPTKAVVGVGSAFVENAASKKFADILGSGVGMGKVVDGNMIGGFSVPSGHYVPETRDYGKPKCYFCNNLIAEYEVMHEEDVGWEERLACCLCFKKGKFSNFKKL